MPKFTASLNLPQYGTAPASPINGDVYYNTTDSKVYSRINGAWVDLGATGGGGGGATVYYQTSEPSSPVTGDIWVDSDDNTALTTIPVASTSQQGIVQLDDSTSSTSTTTAATANSVRTIANQVAGIDYFINSITSGDPTLISSYPKWTVVNSTTVTAGTSFFNSIVPYKNITVSSIAFISSATAAVGTTLARFGIATRSGNNMTIVARTASDTTIFSSSLTRYVRTLDTSGGFPATYTLNAGTEYYIGVIVVGASTSPTVFSSHTLATNFIAAQNRVPQRTATGQTDLANGSTPNGTAVQMYFEIL